MSATSRVHDTVLGWIIAGLYQPGDQIPTVRRLMDDLVAGHKTVQRGLDRLVIAGYLEARHGRGFFVTSRDGWPPTGTLAPLS